MAADPDPPGDDRGDESPAVPADLTDASDADLADLVAEAWADDDYRTTVKEHGSHVFVFAKRRVDGAVRGEIVWIAGERAVESAHLEQLRALAEKTGADSATCLTVGAGGVAESAAAAHDVTVLDGDDLRAKLGVEDERASDSEEPGVTGDFATDGDDGLGGLSPPDGADRSDGSPAPPGGAEVSSGAGPGDGSPTDPATDGVDVGTDDGIGEPAEGGVGAGDDEQRFVAGSGGGSGGDGGGGGGGGGVASGASGSGDIGGPGSGGSDGGSNGADGAQRPARAVAESARSAAERQRLDAWDGQTTEADIARPAFDGLWTAVTRSDAVESLADLTVWDDTSR